jgi:hypothetical protein
MQLSTAQEATSCAAAQELNHKSQFQLSKFITVSVCVRELAHGHPCMCARSHLFPTVNIISAPQRYYEICSVFLRECCGSFGCTSVLVPIILLLT